MSNAEKYQAALDGATQGAASAAQAMAAVVRKAIEANKVPDMQTVLQELLRAADTIAEIDRDTRATVRLVLESAASVKAAALTAASQLRAAGQAASASTGRLESAYNASTGSVVADASLSNVVRAGLGIVFAANEAARQMQVAAGRIRL